MVKIEQGNRNGKKETDNEKIYEKRSAVFCLVGWPFKVQTNKMRAKLKDDGVCLDSLLI